ncbi:MAG: elongation factor P [Candidatus Moranbacteria bacterium]|nr:elongation factor P [Candidatus Moranbacteria bacterium]NTW46198.1 elongation factor P [Candidatus Moranbacteria bacterium]
MLGLTDIKNGKKIVWDGQPYVVLEYQHSKTGRAGAVMRTKLRNLLTGATIEYTFQDKDKFEEAEVTKSSAQFLYPEGDEYHFMDSESYEQFAIPAGTLGDATKYLIEGTEVTVLNYAGRAINVELPVKMEFEVKEAPPGIKGDTASGGDKVVVLENGLTVTVPLFINAGDRLIVNTEKGTYVSRA